MKRLAWGLWALFVLLGVASIVIAANAPGENDEAFTLALIGYVTVGALIASRHERNLVGWLLLAVGVAWAVSGLRRVLRVARRPAAAASPGCWRSRSGTSGWRFTGIALPLVFPTGRLLSPRWRPVVWLLAAGSG